MYEEQNIFQFGKIHDLFSIRYLTLIFHHRKIETTMIYVDLYKQIYGVNHRGEFITKIALTKKDRIILMNEGWTLVEKKIGKIGILDGLKWF